MDGHSPPNGDAFAQKILRRNPSEQYCFLDVRGVAARSVPGASAETSGMRPDVCRTPSPVRLVSNTSSHPRPAPVAKCDSWIKSRTRQACTPRSCKYQRNCPRMGADAALLVGGCG